MKALAQEAESGVDDAPNTEDIFEFTNLAPRMTGLPMSVWVSQRGNARHDVRIKVNMSHGRKMAIENTAVVAVRPTPRVVVGELSGDDRRLVFDWIKLNHDAIIGYWNDDIDTGQFLEQIKSLPSDGP